MENVNANTNANATATETETAIASRNGNGTANPAVTGAATAGVTAAVTAAAGAAAHTAAEAGAYTGRKATREGTADAAGHCRAHGTEQEYPRRRLRREQEEAPEGVCPYFIRDRGRGVIYCECARFHFPDKLARREIVYAYCAHPSGYKQCVLKQAMDGFYRRKYDRLDAVPEGGEA